VSVKAEPWQKAEIAGPKKALLILKPEVISALWTRAKRPILIVGHHVLEENTEYTRTIDHVIRLCKATNTPLVVTAHTSKAFIEKGFQPTAIMSAMEIGNRLQDSEWQGLDGQGAYDLASFIGLPYYMQFLILSGLKHFSSDLRTISLDRYYNPHARWSFPNMKVIEWQQHFETILNKLETKETK
jgi:acetyl-CoA decarbonylase/synthase complex subunit epsilon